MVKMKGKKTKFIQYGIILLILLFLSGILLVLKCNQERNYNMNRWNDSINNIVQLKVTKIQILNFTPSGETKYDVEREKYDDFQHSLLYNIKTKLIKNTKNITKKHGEQVTLRVFASLIIWIIKLHQTIIW